MKNWKMNYKTIGIVLLVLSILNLLPFLAMPLIIKGIMLQIAGKSVYFAIVTILMTLLNSLINVWMLLIAIKMTREEKYNKQILYFFYVLAGMNFLAFLLYLPLGKILVLDFVLGILTYYFGIKQDNKFSRLVKGK